jgi:hypothetical protein
VKCNGTYALLVQTRHGQFWFPNQKFACPENGSSAFLQATQDCPSAVTQGLEALAVGMCLNARSYEKARQTLVQVTGHALLTRQTLCNWVIKTAQRLDKHLTQEVQEALESPLPPLSCAVDVYDPDAKELVVLEDGILVKAQKPTHEKQSAIKKDKPCQFHQSYFSLVPRPDGQYQFVLGTSDATTPLRRALRAFVCQHWQQTDQALCLVAITDGAKDLRNDLLAAFGTRMVTILDWFHLRKKVCELCSMLVSTKETRTRLKKQLLKLLFHGQVSEALQVLEELPVRNALMHAKLVTYLTKHTEEIIDYARRAQAKKPIGSGRMEKGVDQVIGIRQKDKGMSWSKRGSYALGMLTAYCANGRWEELWDTSQLLA